MRWGWWQTGVPPACQNLSLMLTSYRVFGISIVLIKYSIQMELPVKDLKYSECYSDNQINNKTSLDHVVNLTFVIQMTPRHTFLSLRSILASLWLFVFSTL